MDEFNGERRYLGCHIRQTSAPLRQQPCSSSFLQLVDGTQTEVRDLQGSGCIEEKVFGLQVAVTNAFGVYIVLQEPKSDGREEIEQLAWATKY